jgi:predicted MFS family arabinose efflux permease
MGFLPEEEHHGTRASLFSASRGIGIGFGAMLAGVAIESLRGVGFLAFGQTQGYAAMFAVASAFLLASTPLLFEMNIDGRCEA